MADYNSELGHPDPSREDDAPVSVVSQLTDQEQDHAFQELLNPIKYTDDELRDLWSAVKRARDRVKRQEEMWDILLKEYLPLVRATDDAELLKVNVHFRNVHAKIGQLSFRAPDIVCTPKGPLNKGQMIDPQSGQPLDPSRIIALKRAVLNWYLGPEGVNASRLIDECAFDILAYSGLGATKIGYTATMTSIERPVMQPDPTFQPPQSGTLNLRPAPVPPQVPKLGPDGQPVTETVQVPVYEEWYWKHLSSKKVLFNDDLHSTRYDEDATWMGHDFFMQKDMAQRVFGLSDNEAAQATDDDRVFKHSGEAPGKRDQIRGVELWRKAAQYRAGDQPHPLALDHIVLIDGVKNRTVVCRPSPDQSFDEQGQLTTDSLIGFPIHIFTIRDLTDSPFPPADSAFTNSQAKELNTYRRQQVQLRDRAIGKQLADAGAFEDEEIDRLKNGEVGDIIFVKPGSLVHGAEALLANTAMPEATQDSYEGGALIEQDMQKAIGISGPAGLGTPENTVRSATELAQAATSASGRIQKEQARLMGCYVAGARKLDALIQRYAQGTQYVPLVGRDGTQQLLAWNKQLISGSYTYDILPNSSYTQDSTTRLRLNLSLYNLIANDPTVNRRPILQEIFLQMGHDPTECLLTPQQIQELQQPPHEGKAAQIHQKEGAKTGHLPNAPAGGHTPSRTM